MSADSGENRKEKFLRPQTAKNIPQFSQRTLETSQTPWDTSPPIEQLARRLQTTIKNESETVIFGIIGLGGMSADLGEHRKEKTPSPQTAKQMSPNFRNIPWKLREPLLAILPPSKNLLGDFKQQYKTNQQK